MEGRITSEPPAGRGLTSGPVPTTLAFHKRSTAQKSVRDAGDFGPMREEADMAGFGEADEPRRESRGEIALAGGGNHDVLQTGEDQSPRVDSIEPIGDIEGRQ